MLRRLLQGGYLEGDKHVVEVMWAEGLEKAELSELGSGVVYCVRPERLPTVAAAGGAGLSRSQTS
jgi:hypothetical protein